jgi:hypothetical protein
VALRCTRCHGPLPRYPERARDQAGSEWEFCTWKCSVLWQAEQGIDAAQAIAGRMFEGVGR